VIYSGHARKALPPSSAWTGVGLGNTLTLAQLVGSGRIPEQGEQHNVDGPLWRTLYGILDANGLGELDFIRVESGAQTPQAAHRVASNKYGCMMHVDGLRLLRRAPVAADAHGGGRRGCSGPCRACRSSRGLIRGQVLHILIHPKRSCMRVAASPCVLSHYRKKDSTSLGALACSVTLQGPPIAVVRAGRGCSPATALAGRFGQIVRRRHGMRACV